MATLQDLLIDDLKALRQFGGFKELTPRIITLPAVINQGQPFNLEIIKNRFLAAIYTCLTPEQIDGLLVAYGFAQGYEDIPSIEKRREVYGEKINRTTRTLRTHEDIAIEILARNLIDETKIYSAMSISEASERIKKARKTVDVNLNPGFMQDDDDSNSRVFSKEISQLCSILLGFPLSKLTKGVTPQIADSVKSFAAEKYTSPLFFEKNNPDAPTLENVYTFQNYITYGLPKSSGDNEHTDLEALICNFLEEESDSRSEYFRTIDCITNELSGLIILANAGMGKSSILSWIAYNHARLFPTNRYKHVYLAKLRDLSEQVCSIEQLAALFDEIKEYIEGSIFLLDAFDEFATNSDDGKRSKFIESLCYQIYKNGGKLIITSRLNYFEHLNPEKFAYALVIGLCPFTSNQATQWWKKYIGKKPASFVRTNFPSIRQKINDSIDRKFFGIPLVLYMIAYSGVNIDAYKTKYDLYTALFGVSGIRLYGAREGRSDIMSPNYNKRYMRFSADESSMLFNVLCDIAYRIYQNENDNTVKGCVLRHQVCDIIKSNYPEEYEAFLTNHYSIASYFRGDVEGMIEFIHRSIFDYYLARWVLREYYVYQRRKAFEMMRHTSNATNSFLLQAIVAEGIEDVALVGLNLSGADFTGIDVKANLKGANLSRVIVKGGALENAIIDETTILEGIITH